MLNTSSISNGRAAHFSAQTRNYLRQENDNARLITGRREKSFSVAAGLLHVLDVLLRVFLELVDAIRAAEADGLAFVQIRAALRDVDFVLMLDSAEFIDRLRRCL